jgi:glycerol uptake facilitator-like aquaporin
MVVAGWSKVRSPRGDGEDRSGRSRTAPAAVGAYIGAAYFFTSSASFANPAITIGRMFSATFAGIGQASDYKPSDLGYTPASASGTAVGGPSAAFLLG